MGKNPAGYLRKAIEEDYTPPQGFTTRAQREEQERTEKEKQQQHELQKKEEQYRQWLSLSDEQKIKGDLWLWHHRFKKAQQRNPLPEEIDAQKLELISKLPTPEEKRRQIFGDT